MSIGEILVFLGIGGLILTAVLIPIAVWVLRRQARNLIQRIQQEYEE